MAAPPDREPGYTVLIVRERGLGAVHQLRVATWQLSAAKLFVIAAAVALISGWIAVLLLVPSLADQRRLTAENLRLRDQVLAADHEAQDIANLVERLNRYDKQLRQLEEGGRLSAGPIDPAEAAARAATDAGEIAYDAADPDTLAARWEALSDQLGGWDIEAEARLSQAIADLAKGPPGAGGLPEIWPVEGRVTSRYGWRIFPFTGRWAFHGGLDLGAPLGQPIYATSAGVVVYSDWNSGHGQMVVIDHGGGVQTRYAHASELLVLPGDAVETGDTVALVGSTGLSTGPHLHYDLIIDGARVDPLDYLPER